MPVAEFLRHLLWRCKVKNQVQPHFWHIKRQKSIYNVNSNLSFQNSEFCHSRSCCEQWRDCRRTILSILFSRKKLYSLKDKRQDNLLLSNQGHIYRLHCDLLQARAFSPWVKANVLRCSSAVSLAVQKMFLHKTAHNQVCALFWLTLWFLKTLLLSFSVLISLPLSITETNILNRWCLQNSATHCKITCTDTQQRKLGRNIYNLLEFGGDIQCFSAGRESFFLASCPPLKICRGASNTYWHHRKWKRCHLHHRNTHRTSKKHS